MKIKYDLIQSVIIYILVILASIVLIFVVNYLYLADDQALIKQAQLISANNITIYKQGADVSHEMIEQAAEASKTVNSVYQKEVIVMMLITISGLLIIIRDIVKKFNLLIKAMDQVLIGVETLELQRSNKSKYYEINQIEQQTSYVIMSLQQKDQQRRELYENMVHDFKTPLHIIKGNLELAAHGFDLDHDIINMQLERLENLCKNNINQHNGQISEMTSQELSDYLYLLQQVYPGYKYQFNLDENICFITSKESLYRIIDNLFSNIKQHAKAKTIFVDLTENHQEIHLVIANDGQEISETEIKRIFNRNVSQKSSGLGLDIVRQIIDNLNYQLILESNSKQTSFKIMIRKNENLQLKQNN